MPAFDLPPTHAQVLAHAMKHPVTVPFRELGGPWGMWLFSTSSPPGVVQSAHLRTVGSDVEMLLGDVRHFSQATIWLSSTVWCPVGLDLRPVARTDRAWMGPAPGPCAACNGRRSHATSERAQQLLGRPCGHCGGLGVEPPPDPVPRLRADLDRFVHANVSLGRMMLATYMALGDRDAALGMVDLDDLRAYLRAHGWEPGAGARSPGGMVERSLSEGLCECWHQPKGGALCVVVLPEAGDYLRRLWDTTLTALAEHEKRDPTLILAALLCLEGSSR